MFPRPATTRWSSSTLFSDVLRRRSAFARAAVSNRVASGSGPIRHVRLPGNTLQVRGQAVCASIKGIPFEPCFNLEKKDERSFRGSVSGMGFAYCDFRHQGAAQMLMARSVSRPRSLHAPANSRSADASGGDITASVETPKVERARLDAVKSGATSEATKLEGAAELRRSTD